MEQLKVGFGREKVTPHLGIEISGYYIDRFAEKVLDDLEINAVALSDGANTAIIFSLDSCHLSTALIEEYRKIIAESVSLPVSSIYLHNTHSHTTPYVRPNENKPYEDKYYALLRDKFIKCAKSALKDLKPAKIGIGFGEAKNISFLRRFRMKDGSVATNPGVNNPNIVAPIGVVDESVNVIRIDREKADSIVIVNFGTHPDVIGGNNISADWPGLTRRYVEKSLDNVKCICLNGVQGDVNHVNVFPKGGDMNGLKNDFDDVARGYEHSKYMGRVLTAAVLTAFDKVEYLDNADVKVIEKRFKIPSNMPTKEELPLAHKYNDLHNAGRDDEIPFKAMALTTVVAESARKVRLENGPEFFEMPISVIKVGKIAFVSIPGEPFTGVGLGIKDTKGYKMICPTCITNGAYGYFPMQEAYDEGGYETGTSQFKAGCAELIVKYAKELLKEVNK